jgi:N-acetylglucosaminyldiphosphoundecaprenol N-acetyl-beta-D-mannosaminyltransferase
MTDSLQQAKRAGVEKVVTDSLHQAKRAADARLLGIRLDTGSLPELVAAAERAIAARGSPFIFACANPHSLVTARTDGEFQRALERADAVVADGVGCRWGAALSGVSIGPRITGTDFFVSTMKSLNASAGRAFFFGAGEAALAKLKARVLVSFPRVTTGSLSPPFRPWSEEENRGMIDSIRDFCPDVLWVGMTAPKQEKWVAANAEQLAVPVIASIGAVFDYYALVTPRAPQWICDLGFEWLYRLPREPRRLWRRTFVSAPAFLWYAMLQRLHR